MYIHTQLPIHMTHTNKHTIHMPIVIPINIHIPHAYTYPYSYECALAPIINLEGETELKLLPITNLEGETALKAAEHFLALGIPARVHARCACVWRLCVCVCDVPVYVYESVCGRIPHRAFLVRLRWRQPVRKGWW